MSLLSIVVTCTDRKVSVPVQGLRARDLPPGDVRLRAAEWKRRVIAAEQRVPLVRLYQGDHWTRAQQLATYAAKAGFTPDVWVASAGLGLKPVSSAAPAYAATFSPRHADSVAVSPDGCAAWWQSLQADGGGAQLDDLARRGQLLLVLSEVYAKAMAPDLRRLGTLGAEALLIGGSQEFPGLARLRTDATLRDALGGTLTSLNVRMAAAWLERCSTTRLTSPETHKAWQSWASQVAKQERYDRKPMTDEAVIEFIRNSLALHPDYSRTRLLRELRSQNLACEQKRFANLYAATLENR